MLCSIIIVLLLLLVTLVQPHISNAIIVHDNKTNLDLDTSKPFAPQYNSFFIKLKNTSPTQFSNFTQHFGQTIENVTNGCSSPMLSLLPKVQGLCDTLGIPAIYVICHLDIIKQSIFECSNPRLNDYISTHGIRDPDANLRYGIEKQYREAHNGTLDK